MVPDRWKSTTFENHIDLLSGYAFKSNGYTDQDGDIRLLRGDNIEPGAIRWRNAKLWPANEYAYLERYHLQVGDFVIAMDRTWISSGLKVAEIKEADTPCILVQRVSRIRAKTSLNQKLLRQYFSSHKFEQYVKSVQTETAVPHISARQIRQFPLLLPPTEEQTKIAKILSAWDQAIETTEKLIENSKAQKKALMQQLLTGKKRYSEFVQSPEPRETKFGNLPMDWLFVEIGEIATEQSERAGEHKGLPVLSCSKHDGFVDSLKYFKKKVYSDDTSNYKVVRRGCYGFPSNHIEEGSIGYQNVYDIGIVSPIYSVFETNSQVHDGYLYRLLKTEHYRQIFQAQTNASVDRRGSLRWKEFGKIRVPLPPYAEQKKIAETINSADTELNNLNNQLLQLQAQKKALMQQLLTGKRRVKVAA